MRTTIRFSCAALLAAVALAPCGLVAEQQVSQRVAERVALSTGEVCDVLVSSSFNANAYTVSVLLRDEEDNLLTAQLTGDHARKAHQIKLASGGGKTKLFLAFDLGFLDEGMKTPVVVEIDGARSRALLGDSQTDQTRKIQSSIGKLPAGFLRTLRLLHGLAEDQTYKIPAAFFVLEDVTDALGSGVVVVDRTPLTDAEVGALQSRFSRD